MNRVITLLIIFLVTGLMLPSCGISLEKRQHTGGYYVNVNPRKQAAKEHKTAPEQEAVAENAVRTSSEPVSYEERVPSAMQETPAVEGTQELAIAEAPASTSRMDAAPGTDEEPFVQHSEEKSLFAQVVERSPVKNLHVKKVQSAAGHSGDGLSLFWIIILILLVLWAAGLISGGWGLGWVINVLLVIALVLLILWLLRIV